MGRSFKVCYLEFVNDLLYVCIGGSGIGPDLEDMIAFLSRCSELEHRRHMKKLFEMCCPCFSHWTFKVPYQRLGSANRIVVASDLSSVARIWQYFLLLLGQDCSFSSSGVLVNRCCEILEAFGETAFQPNYLGT